MSFELQGAHLAVACFECHKKQDKWSFRNIGKRCVDCHKDIHKSTHFPEVLSRRELQNLPCGKQMEPNKFRPFENQIFSLTGIHSKTNCRACHFKQDKPGTMNSKSSAGLPKTCISCHNDNHNKQFEKNGITDCSECHGTENWKASKFNHDKTAFKLDGKHQNVACAKCHKPGKDEKYCTIQNKRFQMRNLSLIVIVFTIILISHFFPGYLRGILH